MSTDLRSIYQVEWSAHSLASESPLPLHIFVTPCDSGMFGANDSHYAKDFSNPG